jgi:hypothetical protein
MPYYIPPTIIIAADWHHLNDTSKIEATRNPHPYIIKITVNGGLNSSHNKNISRNLVQQMYVE